MQRPGWFGVLILAAALCGCAGGDANPLNRQPVSGTVTFGDAPLAQGVITFMPDGAAGPTSGGATISQGSFSIPLDKGLAPGKYRVMVSAPEGGLTELPDAPGESDKVAKETIPAKYNAQTELTAEVKAGEKNHFEFKLSK